ncbi:MAG: hypothetical protein AAGI92_00640 [Pseudomonadota bacterium]
MNFDLPPLALSVRQPWAWAIIHGGKTIENRTRGAIKAGGMDCRKICIYADGGMKRDEYEWGHWRLLKHGVRCPRPDALVRSAIVGTVDVVDVITKSDSEWFGGQAGLVLENPEAVEPIPAVGALGYFEWSRSGEIAAPAPWMNRWNTPNGDSATLDLFGADATFQAPPPKPFGTKRQASSED